MSEIILDIDEEILEVLNIIENTDDDPSALVEIGNVSLEEFELFLKESNLQDDTEAKLLLTALGEKKDKTRNIENQRFYNENPKFDPNNFVGQAIKRFTFTSESVTEGHPDKMADQISDAILDAILAQDPTGRVACETMVTTGLAVVAGEITTTAQVDYKKIVRETIDEIGYNDGSFGYDSKTINVIEALGTQSPDIAQGVDTGGAGDQGLMFGFACNETPELMPMPIQLAHYLTKRLSEVRRNGQLPYLRPEGKSQVSVEYWDGRPIRIDSVIISSQHAADVSNEVLRADILEKVIKAVIPAGLLDENTKYHINPTGRSGIGGPVGDAGVTGRKIMVDTYGGYAPHGGGAFSGKDPTKVDRSAAYMARYIAKNIVASGLAEKCTVQLAYAIGVAEPVSVLVETHGTGKVDERDLANAVRKTFPLTPKGIIDTLDLRKPIYKKAAAFGHFGDFGFPWEKTDKVEALLDYFYISNSA